MSSSVFRVRLDANLASALTTLAERWGLPTSVLMRAALRDLITNPERFAERLAARTPYGLEDLRSEQQKAEWARVEASLSHALDLEGLVAQLTQHEGQ
jgi:predicted transcriptional regulator